MSKAPKKGLALILEEEPKGKKDSSKEESDESLGEGEIEAMDAFDAASSSEERAKALKDFIKLCMSAGDYE